MTSWRSRFAFDKATVVVSSGLHTGGKRYRSLIFYRLLSRESLNPTRREVTIEIHQNRKSKMANNEGVK